jgi:U5 small nuclear ribonucleoprotein component
VRRVLLSPACRTCSPSTPSGNYIGALSDSDDASSAAGDVPALSAADAARFGQHASPVAPLEGFDDDDEEMDEAPAGTLMRIDESASNAVVLHEDKKYYPSATEVYGDDVEALVQEEDAQPLTQPIIEPIKLRRFGIEETGLPETRFEREFMMNLMNFPEGVRNVAVVGHLHHGKTSLLDMLVHETHRMDVDTDTNVSGARAARVEACVEACVSCSCGERGGAKLRGAGV